MRFGSQSAIPLEGDLIHSPAGEQYSMIVDRIVLNHGPRGQVLVTSYGEGEGKTTTAANLALAFHARRIPILLAELSLGRPAFQRLFGEAPFSHGIERVLSGKRSLDEVICKRNDNDLRLAMVSGSQPYENLLVPGERLDALLASSRKNYEWAIFDGPSISSTREISAIARSFDLVLIVVKRRVTSKFKLKSSIKLLDHPSALVILNEDMT